MNIFSPSLSHSVMRNVISMVFSKDSFTTHICNNNSSSGGNGDRGIVGINHDIFVLLVKVYLIESEINDY